MWRKSHSTSSPSQIINIGGASQSFLQSVDVKKYTMRYMSLFALVIQNTSLVLLMRYSRTISGPKYLASSAVVLAEVLKVIICLGVIAHENPSTFFSGLRGMIFSTDALKLAIPSGLYAIQNNLLYVALSNLEAAPYQVIYQIKVITTAIFSVLLLNKKLDLNKWLSLILLMIGVALVQLSLTADPEPKHAPNQNPFLGLSAVLASCVTSGFAGVYFEKILKGTPPSLWVRNVQLGVFGIVFGILYMLLNDAAPLIADGFFQGYNFIVIWVVVIQAVGGLIIALVVKYADNILKGFGSAISIVLSSVIAIFIFDFLPTYKFVAGAVLVVLAVYMYSLPTVQPTEKQEPAILTQVKEEKVSSPIVASAKV